MSGNNPMGTIKRGRTIMSKKNNKDNKDKDRKVKNPYANKIKHKKGRTLSKGRVTQR